MRTVRAHSGAVITILISSSLCLALSDDRYCPGDLIQWEQVQYVVLGVGRHQLWFQKTSGNGEVVGFTKEILLSMQAKNAIRLVKKRSTIHRVKSGISKTKFTPTMLAKDFKVKETSDGVDGPEVDRATDQVTPHGASEETPLSELDLENSSVLSKFLLDDADHWTPKEDSSLVEWLEMRARSLGIHPLNLCLDHIISPKAVLERLETDNIHVVKGEDRPGNLNSCAGLSCVADFNQRFQCLKMKPLTSLRVRALLLLHLNDTTSPLLSLVYDPRSVKVEEKPRAHPCFDIMSPFTTMLLAHRHLIFLEVKFCFGFRQGWSTMMTHCMLESGPNSVVNMLQKKTLINERKPHQPFVDGAITSSATTSTNSKISFTAGPMELPILPYRSANVRGNGADLDGKHADEALYATIRSLNSLNNPLHPSNASSGGNCKAPFDQDSTSVNDHDPNLNCLSIYYFEECSSVFLNWSISGLCSPNVATTSTTAPNSALSNAATILGLPAINLFALEPQRLYTGAVDYSKKSNLEKVYERDYRWCILTDYQSSLLGQFMQTIEKLNVQRQHGTHNVKVSNSAESDPTSSASTTTDTTCSRSTSPEGPWDCILRSVFRGGTFWDDQMSPYSRPVSVNVSFLLHQHNVEILKKETRGKNRHVTNGAMDSARSATMITPRQSVTPTSTSNRPDLTSPSGENTCDKDIDIDQEKDLDHSTGIKSWTRLQRIFHLLQTNAAVLLDGGTGGELSPWGSLRIFIVEAVGEVMMTDDE